MARHAKGDIKEAEADCDAALALAPEQPGLYNCRGLIRQEMGRIDEAISLMEDFDRRQNYERRLLLYENNTPYREETAD